MTNSRMQPTMGWLQLLPLTCFLLLLTTTTTEALLENRHLRFAVIPKWQDNLYFQIAEEGCKKKAERLTQKASAQNITIECVFQGPKWDDTDTAAVQEKMVHEMVDRGDIDGIAISVFDERAIVFALNEARRKGIPLITFDSDVSKGDRDYFVGTNNSLFGRQLGRAMAQLSPGGGSFGVLLPRKSADMRERYDGILKELAVRRTEIHQWEEIRGSPRDANGNVEVAIDHLDLMAQQKPTVIVSVSGLPMRIMVDHRQDPPVEWTPWIDLIEKHHDAGISFVCGDAMPHQTDLFNSNYVQALVGQDPYDMGQKSIETLFEMVKNPTQVLTTSNEERVINTDVMGYHVRQPIQVPEREVDHNLLGGLAWVGFSLCALTAVTALSFIGWVYCHRNVRVVRVSQPRFLIMIASGVLIMCLALIPFSMDDGGGEKFNCFQSPGDDSTPLDVRCEAICMSPMWLICVGFTTCFSALYAKTWRINKVLKSQSAFSRVKVKETDVLLPFAILLTLNFVILLFWTFIDPLTYTREPDSELDGWNRVVATRGRCKSAHLQYYLIPLAVVNLGVLLMANWQAYEARDIEAEFAEAKYIGITMASMLQALISGLPVLFIVYDIPEAFYMVSTLLLFVISMVILMIIFVPKVLFTREFLTMSAGEQRAFIAQAIRRAASVHTMDSSGGNTHQSPRRRVSSSGTARPTWWATNTNVSTMTSPPPPKAPSVKSEVDSFAEEVDEEEETQRLQPTTTTAPAINEDSGMMVFRRSTQTSSSAVDIHIASIIESIKEGEIRRASGMSAQSAASSLSMRFLEELDDNKPSSPKDHDSTKPEGK